jgi:hypothetical protein
MGEATRVACVAFTPAPMQKGKKTGPQFKFRPALLLLS